MADTNIYISALNFGGAVDDVLLLGRTGVIELFISPPIIEEISRVLVRKFRWSTPRVREAVHAIGEFVTVVHPHEVLSAISEDESDNRILECGLACRADVIVSGDRHLLKLHQFRGILIVTARHFLDRRFAP